MKIRIALAVIVCGTMSLSAQKNTWTIGIYSGIQGQLSTSIEQKSFLHEPTGIYVGYYHGGFFEIKTIHRISSAPPSELIVQYKITDNFSIASGIGYILHKTQGQGNYFGIGTDLMTNIAHKVYIVRPSLQVPLIFQYDIPLKNTGFSFFGKFGVYFDFRFEEYYGGAGIPDSIYHDVLNDKTYRVEFARNLNFCINKVNFLIHTGIGVAYKFGSGVGISISGTHNIGTLLTTNIDYNIKLKNLNTNVLEHEFDYHVYNRNQNWNVLFGLTYTFKQKKKE